MNKKISNLIIYIIVFVIIIASFIIPNLLCEMQENNIQMAVYEKENQESNINVEAEKIYLVQAIHNIEKEDMRVMIASSDIKEKIVESDVKDVNEIKNKDIEKQILKLKEYNIIKNFEVTNNSKSTIRIIDKIYQKNKLEYMINTISLNVDDYKYQIEVENKTEKILSLLTQKNNLNSDISKEELMRKYIDYLDLHIIDDWFYEDSMLKSSKAGLVVNLVESGKYYILSIHSTDKISNNIEYVMVN